MYTPRTSVEAIPNASIHHSALQNRDFGHTYDRSRALVRALGHNKWICGSECCMCVWERLHVHGRRIFGRARRRRKFTDSYPFKKQIRFL